VMKLHGGTRPEFIRMSLLGCCGWKHTDCQPFGSAAYRKLLKFKRSFNNCGLGTRGVLVNFSPLYHFGYKRPPL